MPKPIYTEKEKASINKVDVAEVQFLSEARNIIEENWKILSERRQGLFNSTLLRVINFNEVDDAMVINCAADITYKDVTGLRYASGDKPRAINEEDIFMSLSAYLFVITSDNKLILLERDSGDWNEALDLPGGFVQDRFNIIDLADFAIRRTEHDLLIDKSRIESLQCMGLFDFSEILELMAIYKVKLNVTLAELRAISTVKMYEMPEGYMAHAHDEHFDMRMHYPCAFVIAAYLDRVMA